MSSASPRTAARCSHGARRARVAAARAQLASPEADKQADDCKKVPLPGQIPQRGRAPRSKGGTRDIASL
jgi:hypothetical protein